MRHSRLLWLCLPRTPCTIVSSSPVSVHVSIRIASEFTSPEQRPSFDCRRTRICVFLARISVRFTPLEMTRTFYTHKLEFDYSGLSRAGLPSWRWALTFRYSLFQRVNRACLQMRDGVPESRRCPVAVLTASGCASPRVQLMLTHVAFPCCWYSMLLSPVGMKKNQTTLIGRLGCHDPTCDPYADLPWENIHGKKKKNVETSKSNLAAAQTFTLLFGLTFLHPCVSLPEANSSC